MALKTVQCAEDGCGGEVQVTVDSDKEITDVYQPGFTKANPDYKETCPECDRTVAIATS